ncbi:uncharacterized protein LOC119382105 [Rhipicephalus sanguineus]|uniref:uncharacterized protein LOC119382105 n=1 Tax=Rhipicephalus sanguineus TaxID=34632 RepID=UPI0020C50688|nr:uncharacterized protein LOC119382105 [Rhipicephalus sanguineus]
MRFVTSSDSIMKARIEDGVVYSPHPSIDIPLCSFCCLTRERLLVNPDKTALVDDATSLTRVEVLSRMQRYAVGFRQNGVVPGDRICIYLKNSIDNLLAAYGCIMAGATVVLAKTSLTESELRYEAEDSDSTHVLTDVELTEKVSRAVQSLPLKGLFCMGHAAGFVSAAEFAKLDEKEYQELPVPDPKNTVLAVAYTSGTTGLPKGTELTHYNFVACVYSTTLRFHGTGGGGGGRRRKDRGVINFVTGKKLGPHEIGEIRFQIDGMARGYYKRPKESAELFDEEGWCKSGDAGYYDEDGRLYIVERLKQLIKCRDNQVVPAELEELLLREHSTDIAEISIVGLPHSEYGEAPAAAVVLTREGRNKDLKLLAGSIKATVQSHLATHKHLHGGVIFLESLPKTDTGKVNKPKVVRLITQEQTLLI